MSLPQCSTLETNKLQHKTIKPRTITRRKSHVGFDAAQLSTSSLNDHLQNEISTLLETKILLPETLLHFVIVLAIEPGI